MKVKAEYLLAGGILFPIFLCGTVAFIYYWQLNFDMCGNTVISETPSPDNRLKAVVFERDCGATTGFSTQVSILPRGSKLPDESGNIFILDGEPEVRPVWVSPSALTIRCEPANEPFLKLDRFEEVKIDYETGRNVLHQN